VIGFKRPKLRDLLICTHCHCALHAYYGTGSVNFDHGWQF